ncbi:anaerobic C4-dicarboxylate transporter family protein [Flaviflexus huanghaiensis]|uniref:anaerobic C4-dicarboxylate transporter family protein n=1 Tax=Flaviflexus huanghaiensis TaxID=1111473 RepID=UPI0019D5B8FF
MLLAIFLGARYGSIAIGFAGGLGVIFLGITGASVTQDDIPFDVIGIIMSVIAAIAAMQAAGGMDWLVSLTDRLLRKNPKRITQLAPAVTYFLTLFAGTGHTAFAALPVIAEVAKENKIRPSRPLSISVVASQMAITASPISAAVVFMASILEPMGVGYLTLLSISIPSTFLAVMLTSFLVNFLGKPLEQDPVYQERMARGLVQFRGAHEYVGKKGAKTSVFIFLAAIILVVVYAASISENLQLIEDPTLPRNEAIMSIMLATAMVITIVTKIKPAVILNMQTFKSGMSASVCVLGVAWLGTTFVNEHIERIEALAVVPSEVVNAV